MRIAFFLPFSIALLIACNTEVHSGDGGGGSGGHGGAGGNAPACPTFAPDSHASCSEEGTSCTYDQGDECYSNIATAVCTDGAWVVTQDTHDDCCPDVAPVEGEPCTPATLSGGLVHPCSFPASLCDGYDSFVCSDGAWKNSQPACPPPP